MTIPALLSLRLAQCFRRSLVALLLLALGLHNALPAWAQAGVATPYRPLPALGDAASDDLTVGAERKLGDRIMQEIRRDPDVIDDPLLLDYVGGLWQALVQAARVRGEVSADLDSYFAWEPFLVRDRSINAFALPGGFIGVHLGLVAMTTTRDELASVLAHEMSHVTQRHIARSIAPQRRQSILGVAAMILGVMAAARSNRPDGANAMIVGGQAAMVQGQLNFSRDMEREADRVGFSVLGDAGFDPVGMVGMFERLQQGSRLTDSGQFPYLRSHPLTSERIGEARSRLGVRGAGTSIDAPGSGGDAARWLHAAMQGRARALMDPRTESLQRLAAMPLGTQGPPALNNAYATTLAALRLKDWRSADAALARAQMLAGSQPAASRAVDVLQAELLLEKGRAAEASAVVAERLGDGSRAARLLAARAALALPADAGAVPALRAQAEALQSWVATRGGDASAWQLLGQLQDRLGQRLAALRAQAEAQLALGDLGGAIDRLRAGQRLARTDSGESIDALVIEARLKVLEQRRRAEMRDERGAGGDGPRG
ncbi:MAG: M48 family metalloprotease [Burkholderiales bacterium]